MTAEPKLPPLPARFTFSNACKNEFEVYGLQCFEAGRQQGMTQERALHGLAASSREIEAGHQWQDIETAPKDGTVVILWSDADARFDNNGNGGRWLGCFAGGVWVSTVPVLDEWNDGGGNLMLNPTHWQPFPSPPKA